MSWSDMSEKDCSRLHNKEARSLLAQLARVFHNSGSGNRARPFSVLKYYAQGIGKSMFILLYSYYYREFLHKHDANASASDIGQVA